ncbi:MAG: efflux RND transporter permease subunit [Hyphomicrobiaceae bacterium]|nr:efflux RND transporter permease subunit [Hyphomicrobiaceae bacterium]
MKLSDVSITRPVFASVLALILVVFGLVAYDRLPLRQYPDIDPPVVSVDTTYRGASAKVVENRVTELIEERISGVEGIRFISSSSEDGRSRINVEFKVGRDVDAAANDIRDRVSTILDDLPIEAEPPEIQKVDANDDVIMWLNLASDRMTVPELTDYAERYLVDRFSVLDGVARVRIGGGQQFAMRIWIDRKALAARELTVADVERSLRAENVELPAGSIESLKRQFTVRLDRNFKSAEDFSKLVLKRGENGYLVRLGDVARVEKASIESRTFFRGNGVPMVGLGIIKQSTANTIAVARAAKAERDKLAPNLPDGMKIADSYDTSVFIEGAISEVYKTLFIAIGLVILVILVFLGSWRAMIVPAVTVPISIIATFIVLYMLDFSVNLLTLLALVLAIGMVVDDAIVVLENIYRRIDDLGETPLVAAYLGTRQVGFAVIATTLVLIAVFVPIAFLEGDVGRLFAEFALTMSAAVAFSSFVALSLSPMIASQLLKPSSNRGIINRTIDRTFSAISSGYGKLLRLLLRWYLVTIVGFVGVCFGIYWLLERVPSEYAPKEDRGAFFVLVNGPEGATYDYMKTYMDEIERRLMAYTETGEATRLLVRAPRSFGTLAAFNSGIAIFVLDDWAKRRSGFTIMNEIRGKLADLPGVRAFPVMRQGFGRAVQKPVQFVVGGGTYEELARWRDILNEQIAISNPGLEGVDWDYKETKPQIDVKIDYDRAAELGVSVSDVGRTLETMLGSRKITTFIDAGQEYDVIVEGERETQRTPTDIENIYVRSNRSGQLIPLSNLVRLAERADSGTLNRFNRVRAITLEANLKDDVSLGEAIGYLEGLVRTHLPETAIIDYKGQSRDFKSSSSSILFAFILGVLIVFLVLAAQFESWLHPFIIMLTVPLAMLGGLLGLYLTGGSLNIYSQVGLIALVGLAAKNGILIVEFANQLRDEGRPFDDALLEAATIRLRPILMTGITTVAGAVPLMLSFGAGAETRTVIGVVILAGVSVATLMTLFVVPVAYSILARRTGSPGDVRRRLDQQLQDGEDRRKGNAGEAPAPAE